MTAPQHTAADGDDFTELVDAQFPRVDLVGKAANGSSGFLVAKSAADGGLTQPLIPADMVADLIAKADAAQETPVTDSAPTITKAEIDVTDAPEPDALVPDAPGGSTANSLPGSADWEQLDGDTAMNAVATLGRVKACLGWLADREAQEGVVNGDGDDYDNAFDLQDMSWQVDCLIGRLAGFAVGEHLEAEQMEAVGKAVAAVAAAAAPLGVLEGFAPIAKAGRVLSASNEAAIRGAVESLQGVLASLPAAPAADDVTKTEETDVAKAKTLVIDVQPRLVAADGEPVEKGTDMAAELLKGAKALTAVDVFRALLAGGQKVDVTKAKGDPQMAVFSADGKLVGVIDPADLNPIAATEAPSEGDTEGSGDDAPADAPADDQPAAAPAADDSRTIPGTDTVQAPADQPPAADDDTQTPAVAKAAVDAALKEALAPFAEQLGAIPALAKAYGDLEERVAKMGAQPDDRRSPVLNGGGKPGAAARDNHHEDPLEDVKKAIAAEPDPAKRMAMSKEAFLAVASRFTQG